jgi:DNA-binding winged helix-turn-helix (wHTH) protein
MQRRNLRTNTREIARRHTARRWTATNPDADRARALLREISVPLDPSRSSSTTADAALEFRRFRVLLRQRQLLADGVLVELGTRAFDLLLALIEADGLLLSKEALLSRVWPGIVVSEENLKVQMSALRKALGADRDVIRTEFGRGYRFTGVLCTSTAADARQRPTRAKLRPAPTLASPINRGRLGRGSQNCWQSLRCRFCSR